jgi:hypothetical protein
MPPVADAEIEFPTTETVYTRKLGCGEENGSTASKVKWPFGSVVPVKGEIVRDELACGGIIDTRAPLTG